MPIPIPIHANLNTQNSRCHTWDTTRASQSSRCGAPGPSQCPCLRAGPTRQSGSPARGSQAPCSCPWPWRPLGSSVQGKGEGNAREHAVCHAVCCNLAQTHSCQTISSKTSLRAKGKKEQTRQRPSLRPREGVGLAESLEPRAPVAGVMHIHTHHMLRFLGQLPVSSLLQVRLLLLERRTSAREREQPH